MSVMTVMPRTGEEWTVDDLDRLPDDGLQYEMLDGLLLVTPAPVPVHQRAIVSLIVLLDAACRPGFEVFMAPLDWRPDLRTSLQPDLLMVRNEDVGPANVTAPLVLAVEVLSPSTRRKDFLLKRSKYEDSGVQSYWIVDPTEPSLLALDLRDGAYVHSAHVSGDDRAALRQPFPLDVVRTTSSGRLLDRLVAGLLPAKPSSIVGRLSVPHLPAVGRVLRRRLPRRMACDLVLNWFT